MSTRINIHATTRTVKADVFEQTQGTICIDVDVMQGHRYESGVDIFCTTAQAAAIAVALMESERVREALSFEERRRMEFCLRTLDEHEFEDSLQP